MGEKVGHELTICGQRVTSQNEHIFDGHSSGEMCNLAPKRYMAVGVGIVGGGGV